MDGSSQTFTASSIQVTFNGLGGTDVAIVQGSGAGQSVTFHPGSAVATGSGYTVNVTAESITVGAGGGSGKVSMYGVPGKTDYFSGNATSAVMSDSLTGKWKKYYNRETGFKTVNAYSTPGDSDVAALYSGANNVFNDFGSYATFSHNQVNAFRYVTAYGGRTANLYASTSTDALVGTPTAATLSDATYSETASGFKTVNAYGVVGGKDSAQVTDDDVKSALRASENSAKLSSLDPKAADYAISMFNFAKVAVTLTNKASTKNIANAIDFLLSVTK